MEVHECMRGIVSERGTEREKAEEKWNRRRDRVRPRDERQKDTHVKRSKDHDERRERETVKVAAEEQRLWNRAAIVGHGIAVMHASKASSFCR